MQENESLRRKFWQKNMFYQQKNDFLQKKEFLHKNGFLQDLLYKNTLPLCRIIVSSRPVASKKLKNLADVKVEILGFTEQSRQMFINNELKDSPDKLVALNSYLKENSIIHNLCYIPFMLSVLVRIVKECEVLPKSQTELYSKFIIYTISRFLQTINYNPPESTISSLNQLPSQFKGYFYEMCRYAYNALHCNKVVFTAKEIETGFPTFARAPRSWSGLGLLKSAEYFSIEDNSDCTSFNFLHLSIQEYLAAYYITTCKKNKQIEILRKSFFDNKYLNMWIMYSGLRPLVLKHFLSGRKMSKAIRHSKLKHVYSLQCLKEIKNHNLEETLFKKRIFDLSNYKLIFDLSNYKLLPKDIDTMIDILDKTPTIHWDELNLSHCNIGDIGCYQLYEALRDLNPNVIFNKMDLSSNQLTTESLLSIVHILFCCKTQELHLSYNHNINSDAELIMEYAFEDTYQTFPLAIHIYNQTSVIYNKLDKQTIITDLNSRYRVTNIYFFNCEVDDNVITALANIITTLQQLCLWNSCASINMIRHILSIEKGESLCLFVYDNSFSVDFNNSLVDFSNNTFVFDNGQYSNPICIFLNNFIFILQGINTTHATSFPNPLLVLLIRTENLILKQVQISNCKLNEVNFQLILHILSQCKTLTKISLLNNLFDLPLLQQLINAASVSQPLAEIVIEHNNMTNYDFCIIGNELSLNQSHSVMIFYNNTARAGFRCYNNQLNDSSHISSIIIKLHEMYPYNITVYEKNIFIDNVTTVYDSCKSIQITYILYYNSTLLLKNIKDTYLILMLLNSESFQDINLFEVVFLNCESNSELMESLTQLFRKCNVTKFTYMNKFFTSTAVNLFISSTASLSSLRELIAYDENFLMDDIDTLSIDLTNNESLSFIIMNNEFLLGCKCSNKLLNDALSLNHTVTDVLLMYCNVNQFTFEALCKISCIRGIGITDSLLNMHGEMVNQKFFDTFISYNKLKQFYLCNNQLQQADGIKISRALQNTSSLEEFSIKYCNIASEEVAEELSAAIRANNSLKKLCLSGNLLGSSILMIVNAMKEISTLTQLDLNGNKSKSEELAPMITSVVTKNVSLEMLLLQDNNLNDEGVIKIAESLCKHSKLKLLNLNSNNITEVAAEALASVISSNTGLEELYLGNNQLGLGATKLATSLKNISSLKVLDLDNNNIPVQVAEELSAAIRANSFLEKLWLNGNHLGSSIVIVINALKEISTLKELHLNDNKNRSKELASAITCVVAKNKFMETMLLSNNSINDEGVIKIAQSLQKHTTLRCLDLQSNNITEEASEALASVISSDIGLEELYLGNNQLGLGATKIATSLKNVLSLKVLDLQNNNIPEQVTDELSAVIKSNNLLEKLWLKGNDLESSTITSVKALKEISTLKDVNLNKNKELIPVITPVKTKNGKHCYSETTV